MTAARRPHPRARCPACGKMIAIRADGQFITHLEARSGRDPGSRRRRLEQRPVCPGAPSPPEVA